MLGIRQREPAAGTLVRDHVHVDVARLDAPDYLLLLLRRAEARDQFGGDGEGGEALGLDWEDPYGVWG